MPLSPTAAMLSLFARPVFTAFLLLGTTGFAAEDAIDAPAVATYRRNISEVRITFFATDARNRPVEKITREDFAVVDSGIVVRDFRSLMKSDETKLDVVALIDTSESVAARFPSTINASLQSVLPNQRATVDNFSVISFGGSQPALVCAYDCRTSAGRKLVGMKPGGATPLYDALVDGANLIQQRRIPGVRPVLILFSDGNDTISRHSSRDALEAIIASGAILYAIDLNPPTDGASASAYLQQLADASGGRYFPPRDGSVHALEAALEDLRSSYVVTYSLPSHATGLHSLRILPKHDLNLRFHSRSSYDCESSVQ
ncbi:MAG TPA: VWA domain-containing protein [Terriglobales bacterium]